MNNGDLFPVWVLFWPLLALIALAGYIAVSVRQGNRPNIGYLVIVGASLLFLIVLIILFN